jgi:hypothetical protein
MTARGAEAWGPDEGRRTGEFIASRLSPAALGPSRLGKRRLISDRDGTASQTSTLAYARGKSPVLLIRTRPAARGPFVRLERGDLNS